MQKADFKARVKAAASAPAAKHYVRRKKEKAMPGAPPPFKYDFRKLLTSARRKMNSRVGSVSISLPFISFSLNPGDLEKRVARELVIRMADKRVLNAFECCDNCVDQALLSLQEIRRTLVDKQVELSESPDSPLFLLIELQAEAIRQFMTFQQRLAESTDHGYPTKHLHPHTRDQYLAALEMLRAHLHRCLIQVSKIASIAIPKISDHMRYSEAWQLEAYERPALPRKDA